MGMTSKERVRAAFEHKTPDRVPCFLKGVDVAYGKLMKHFGVDSYEAVHDKMDIDVWNLWAPYIGPELPVQKTADGHDEFTHEFGYRYIMHWNGAEYNAHTTYYPLQETETIEQLDAWTWPNPDHFDYEAVARECGKHENRALRIGWPGVYQFVTNLVDAEKLYIDMATEPEYAQHLFDKMVEFELEYYGRMFEAADGRIDILCVCDDYGTQNGMLFSNDMWNQFFAKNTKRLADLAHRHGAFYLQHSCGAVRPIIGNLIDCGVDGLDPIQKVAGMEPEGLKADFGDQLCFHGGIDTQDLLPHGTPAAVTAEAERFIETLNKNGGYILGPSQDFEGDVPVENILALYAARRI
ncbi:hypothetical protein PDESU_00453 [Pontiella desulfatans]|uniref:Uroporphyrinogen decarboxylase (URO-D) domain-containing protein n=1 Tax=Pontiella desulfatans TaxID=2750659 RepID=A0A6C2TW53_PONDE|nr:uroporphyrinogen decarboxylase family protein [Pontiella desulfatans]VGO11905.1 hypothetical protein PDESU_00453 [Pontiella desulfatans]